MKINRKELRKTYTSLNKLLGDNSPFGNVDDFKKMWVDDLHEMTGVSKSKLEAKFDVHFVKTTFTINNSREGVKEDKDGLEFIHHLFKNNAIRTEIGTYFENHEVAASPSVNVWRELVESRGVVKGKMFVAAENGDKVMQEYYNLQQLFIKLIMNTAYGVMINKYGKIYNIDVGSSITSSGRHGISILGLFFECLLGKHRVRSLDSCIHFIREVGNEVYSKEGLDFLDLVDDVNVSDVLNSMGVGNSDFRQALSNILNKKSQVELKKLCYKNNLDLLLESEFFTTRMTKVYKATNDYYKIHKNDKDENGDDIKMKDKIFAFCYHHGKHYNTELDEIQKIIQEVIFGYYWYEKDYVPETKTFEESSEELIKTISRYALLLCDTDSDIVTVEDLTTFIQNDYGDKLLTEYDVEDLPWVQSIATATFLVMSYVDYGAERYKAFRGIPENLAHFFDIKNEFAYKDFAITDRKKNYTGDIKVVEGAVLPNMKYDIKGLSFKKSGFNENIGKFAANICREHIMINRNPKDLLIELDKFNDKLDKELGTNEAINYFKTLKLNTAITSVQKTQYTYKIIDLWNSLGYDNILDIPCGFYAIPITVTNDIYKDKFNMGKTMYRKLYSIKWIPTIYKSLEDGMNDHITKLKEYLGEEKLFECIKDYASKVGCKSLQEVIYSNYDIEVPNSKVDNIMGKIIMDIKSDLDNFHKDKTFHSKENNDIIYNSCNDIFKDIKTVEELEELIKTVGIEINRLRSNANNLLIHIIKTNANDILTTDDTVYKAIVEAKRPKLLIASFNSKLYKLSKYYNKVALPRTMVRIPTDILDLVNKSVVLSQADNLVSQLSKSIHLVNAKGIGNIISNVVDSF